MIDKDKVLIGLGQHISGRTPERCGICPYSNGDVGYGITCRDELLDDLYELLEAQEPRVLTLEELAAWQKQPIMARDPIYVEYRKGKGFGAPHWAMDNFGFNVASCRDNYRAGVYGILLRCWTSRPSKEEMEATPWN